MAWQRFRWDMSLDSYRSRAKLKQWKNRFPGGKAVILCNGPSLLKTDWSLLQGNFTFGLNKINLLFEQNSYRPNCIVAVNPYVIEQNIDFYKTTRIPLFLDSAAQKYLRIRTNVCYLHSSSQPKFARDVSVSLQQGFTVTYVALQLAFHMGFRDVALIGCDHNFAQKGPASQTIVANGQDESHFDSRYFSNGMKWQLPDLAASEYYYAMASEAFEEFSGRIINCTDGGKLEIFQRMTLAEWFADTLGRAAEGE